MGFGWTFAPLLLKHKSSPLVLAGSGNVFPLLEDELPLVKDMEPLWLDIGSGGAQKQAFVAFDYGVLLASPKRVGFIAMSSGGTEELEELYKRAISKDSNLPSQKSNFCLSISIAKPPLAIFYRGDSVESHLHIGTVDAPPSDGKSSRRYHTVSFADVREIIDLPTAKFTRYFPEKDTGTRAGIDSESTKLIAWPEYGDKVRSAVDNIDEFSPDSIFEIASYPPYFARARRTTTCDDLARLKIKTAVICSDHESCNRLIPADYKLIIKIKPDFGQFGEHFLIVHPDECKIASALVKSIVNCEVTGDVEDQIITKVADSQAKFSLPPYLTCPEH